MENVDYETLLARDGHVMTHVVGSSMWPLLKDRQSIVLVRRVDLEPPKKGDVVLYRVGDMYVLHRIMRMLPEAYEIRGDNTWRMEYVPRDALLATMVSFYRDARGKEITRENLRYRIYCALLPAIRFVRKWGSRVKRVLKKLLGIGRRTGK